MYPVRGEAGDIMTHLPKAIEWKARELSQSTCGCICSRKERHLGGRRPNDIHLEKLISHVKESENTSYFDMTKYAYKSMY